MIVYLRQSDRRDLRRGIIDPRVVLVLRELDAFIAHDLGVDNHTLEVVRLRGGEPTSEPHELGHAADVRVREYPQDTAFRAVEHLCRVFHRRFMDHFRTAIYETPETNPRATGPHIHIQVPHYPTPGWAVELAMPETEDLPRGIL